jgi:hypothetical protein
MRANQAVDWRICRYSLISLLQRGFDPKPLTRTDNFTCGNPSASCLVPDSIFGPLAQLVRAFP